MNRIILLGLIVAVAVFVCSCATYSSFYGPRKIMPSEVTELLVVFEEQSDISAFRDNEFFQFEIVESVCKVLRKKGIIATNGLGEKSDISKCSHILLLVPGDVSISQGYYQSSDYSYQTGFDSNGCAYTYAVPNSSGTTYTVKEVRGTAILYYKIESDDEFAYLKLCQSSAYGDGMNLLERQFNRTATAQLFGYEKNTAKVYTSVFVDAAKELFAKEKYKKNISELTDDEATALMTGMWSCEYCLGSVKIQAKIHYYQCGIVESRGTVYIDKPFDFFTKGTWSIEKGIIKEVTTYSNRPDLIPIGEEEKISILYLDEKKCKIKVEEQGYIFVAIYKRMTE